MSGSASYSGGSSTNVTETTTTRDYTSTPVVGAGGAAITNQGSGSITINQQGLTPSDVQSLASFGSVLMSTGQATGAASAAPIVVPTTSTGSGFSSSDILYIGLAVAALAAVYFLMKGK